MEKAIGAILGTLLMIGIGYAFAVIAGGSFHPFEWNWFVRILAAGWLAGWLVYVVNKSLEGMT